MRPAVVRRTSTKVVDGTVCTKSRFERTTVAGISIIKQPAGRGFTHVVSPAQLNKFIGIIPDWSSLSYRLQDILLVPGHLDYFGYHTTYRRRNTAMIALHAWPKDLWRPLPSGFFRYHRPIFDALGVVYQVRLHEVDCQFTVPQARAFSLLHVFLHEIGHHQDWLRRRGQRLPGKETYADDFANSYLDLLLPRFKEIFGDPGVVNRIDEPSIFREVKLIV